MIHPSYTELMAVINSEVEEGEQPLVQSRYSIVKATANRAKEIIDARSVEEKIAKARIEASNKEKEKEKDENLMNLPVLVVDDDKTCCESTVATLKEIGIMGEWVLSGREAVERCYARHELKDDYFAVILDWKMPDMDGIETARQIRKRIGKEITIIVLTSYEFSEIEEEAKAAGLYEVIGKEIDDKYMEALKKLVLHPEAIKQMASSLKIVYTPLHGTGNVPVRRVLKELGFEQVTVVPEQELPDGNFPTVSYPNPEDKKAFALALDLAKKVDADLVLATDPDADRLGVYAKDTKTGEYKVFTGNMSGMLICEYEMSQKKALGILPDNGALVRTIASSNMAQAVAKEYGMKFIECLTGFKYIGEQIKFFEQTGSNEYVFGFEESYGCLVGTHARDKDAVVAVMALCEAAAYYKTQGITLWDQMLNIYNKYGYYKEDLFTMTFKGADGAKKMQDMMDAYRKNTPKQVGAYKVLRLRDYKNDVITDLATGETTPTGLPKSNVLYFELENDAWFCVRPSGTEPKIKFYAGIKGTSLEDSAKKLDELMEAIRNA